MTIEIIQFTPKTVHTITHESMSYFDTKGHLRYIDFEVCRQNWILANLPPIHLADLDSQTRIQQLDCIGTRNSVNNPIYIELFTDPHIRFEFKHLWRKIAIDRYIVFKQALGQVGWQLQDLT